MAEVGMSTGGFAGFKPTFAKYLIQAQGGLQAAGVFTLNIGALVNPPGNNAGITVNGGNDLVVPQGVYQYHINFNMTGTLQRYASQKWVRVDGVIADTRGGGDYMRSASGHNETGETMSGLIDVPNATGIMQIQLQRTAGTGGGTVTLLGTSNIALLKVA